MSGFERKLAVPGSPRADRSIGRLGPEPAKSYRSRATKKKRGSPIMWLFKYRYSFVATNSNLPVSDEKHIGGNYRGSVSGCPPAWAQGLPGPLSWSAYALDRIATATRNWVIFDARLGNALLLKCSCRGLMMVGPLFRPDQKNGGKKLRELPWRIFVNPEM